MRSLTCTCTQRAKINTLVKTIKKDSIPKSYLQRLDSLFVKDIERIKSDGAFECPNTEEICELFETPFMGKGVRAIKDISKSAKIGCYIGPIIVGNTVDENWKYTYQYVFKNSAVDGSTKESFTSFFNHSDNPNCDVHYELHNVADLEEIHITFFLKRDVKKGEEIFIDYGPDYWIYAETLGIKKDIRQTLITDYFNYYFD